jgi:hypothetical protein
MLGGGAEYWCVALAWVLKRRLAEGKIQVEMGPFMDSVAVIFGVDFTGPHILVVTFAPLATLP